MRCQRAGIGSVKQFDHCVTFPSTGVCRIIARTALMSQWCGYSLRICRDAAASIGDAVNDDEIGVRVLLANSPRALIFRALIAGKGGRPVLEFNHDISFAGVSFHCFELSAAHDEVRSKFLERRAGRGKVFGISLLVPDRDAYNPIGL